jgi:hypothetical protein
MHDAGREGATLIMSPADGRAPGCRIALCMIVSEIFFSAYRRRPSIPVARNHHSKGHRHIIENLASYNRKKHISCSGFDTWFSGCAGVALDAQLQPKQLGGHAFVYPRPVQVCEG